MYKMVSSLLVALLFITNIQAQLNLRYEENITPTYDEIIEMYQQLDQMSEMGKLFESGISDVGKPIHTFVVSKDGDFNPASIREKGRRVVFVNNGIHPGEPCGIDASIKLLYEILKRKSKLQKLLDNTVLVVIPVYNIGGNLNRSPYHRANQNGPMEHGFRANAMNHDLNRDFIKLDTRNSKSFVQIFQYWNPDVLVDTHTSNGADYQYTMTLIPSHEENYSEEMAAFMETRFTKPLYERMEKSNYEMTPYVNVYNRPPDVSGWSGYVDNPRYTSGYAALFGTIAYITETHMFKEYKDRVMSTYYFILHTLELTKEHDAELALKREIALQEISKQKTFPSQWEADSSKATILHFKGYTAKYKLSKITGAQRLYYDRNEPFVKDIPYYNAYTVSENVSLPKYYIVPQVWQSVIERLQLNGVKMKALEKDVKLKAEMYYIEGFETSKQPYNGHYGHSDVKLRSEKQEIQFYKGDMLIACNQVHNRFLANVLEPQAVDSYFNWNFFDAVLSRKEYFSPYVFEETAEKLLNENPDLKKRFEEKKDQEEAFRKNWYSQLNFIYINSPYYEKTHNRYPVARILYELEL
jgi:hypothetical protein